MANFFTLITLFIGLVIRFFVLFGQPVTFLCVPTVLSLPLGPDGVERTLSQGVTTPSGQTRANCSPVPHFAGCIRSTSTRARVSAVVVAANPVEGALGIRGTFAALARHQSVSEITRRTGADRSLPSGVIVARSANGIFSARIVGPAQILWRLAPAPVEGMSSPALGARANWLVPLNTAFGIHTAGSLAGISTSEIDASPIAGTIRVGGTLRVASCVGVALIILRARANGSVVHDFTIC
jgi:hypothetical protein